MKKLKNGVLLFILITVLSCAKDDMSYSCDPVINAFINENLVMLKAASVEELSTYEDEVQRAAYRSYTAEKKLEVWNSKLIFVANDLSCSPAERAHILLLKSNLSLALFGEENINEFAEFSVFFREWEDIAYNVLAWDKMMVTFISQSLCLYYDDFAYMSTKGASVYRSGVNCDCHKDNDYCSSGKICQTAVCINDSDMGCGIMWLQACDGACQSI